jgi:two-component system sensor histidine kinase/response regulator
MDAAMKREDHGLGLAEIEGAALKQAQRQTVNVVMVDDEEALCLGVRRLIEKYTVHVPDVQIDVDYGFTYCTSGEDFLSELAAGLECDLLLLDLKLPGVGGLEVLDELSRQGREILTIVVTAYATFETAVKATKIGAYDFLAKPFTPDELRNGVRKATSQLILSKQARKLAEEKKQVRFNFISVLAHELKAPLNAIEGYLNILQTRADDEAAPMIDRSLLRLDGMKKLIVDLLDLTRIESGQKPRFFRSVNFREMAQASIDLFAVEAERRDIAITVDAAGDPTFVADADEIEIIFNNLISNAVKYNRDGGVVDIRLARDAAGVMTLSVRDTGIGLTAEEAAKLFNEFTRIKNADTAKILGSGLGLSTVRKLALLYGGDARVESERGVGSLFSVTLRDAVPDVTA